MQTSIVSSSNQEPQAEVFSLFGLHVRATKDISVLSDEIITKVVTRSGGIYTFVNPYAFYIKEKVAQYEEILGEFDGVFCDGIGLVKAARWINGIDVQRISFDSTSLAPIVLQLCRERNWKVFILGGAEGVATRASERIEEQYPGIRIVGTSSGFFNDIGRTIEHIEGSGAQIVICGMGIPSQESFLLQLRSSGWTGVGFTCGGYLDQLSDSFHYYPRWVDVLNLRFAYRLYREPHRLWRRYFVEYRPFFGLLFTALRHRFF